MLGIMPSIPLKHKCLNIILIWVILSHIKVEVVSRKKKKIVFFFFLLFFILDKRTWYWEERWLFSSTNGAEIWPLGIPCHSRMSGSSSNRGVEGII